MRRRVRMRWPRTRATSPRSRPTRSCSLRRGSAEGRCRAPYCSPPTAHCTGLDGSARVARRRAAGAGWTLAEHALARVVAERVVALRQLLLGDLPIAVGIELLRPLLGAGHRFFLGD